MQVFKDRKNRLRFALAIAIGMVLALASPFFLLYRPDGIFTYEYRLHYFESSGYPGDVSRTVPVEFAATGWPLPYLHFRTSGDMPSKEWYQAGHTARTVHRTDLREGIELPALLLDTVFWSLIPLIVFYALETAHKHGKVSE